MDDFSRKMESLHYDLEGLETKNKQQDDSFNTKNEQNEQNRQDTTNYVESGGPTF